MTTITPRPIVAYEVGFSFDVVCERAKIASTINPGCAIHVNTRVEMTDAGAKLIHSVSDWFVDGCTQVTFINGRRS